MLYSDMNKFRLRNKKAIINFFLILFLIMLFSFSTSFAQSTAISLGLSWLSSNQNADGSFGTVLLVRDTTEVADTLRYLDPTGLDYQEAISWIEGVIPSNNDYLARKIIILALSGRDIQSLLTDLISLKNTDGGWGLSSSYEVSNPIDTALGLQALKAANYPDQTLIQSAIDYLLSTQNPDGGFGFYQGDDSNVYMTAVVSSTLQQFSQTTSIATAINKATDYLIAHQNSDGGFATSIDSGQASSTVYETALSYLALVNETTDATVLGNAINYLTSTQLPNGSWDDDPYSTALVLRALASVKPNLAITSNDITFSNPTPTVGDTITITANIKNTGPAPADNVLVQFFDGDPSTGGILIGETTISISPFGSSQTSINYTIPTASSKTIFIRIDALNVIDNLYSKKIANKKGYLDTVNLKGSFGDAVNITYMQVTMFTKFIPT